jgi:hypothetical protein
VRITSWSDYVIPDLIRDPDMTVAWIPGQARNDGKRQPGMTGANIQKINLLLGKFNFITFMS